MSLKSCCKNAVFLLVEIDSYFFCTTNLHFQRPTLAFLTQWLSNYVVVHLRVPLVASCSLGRLLVQPQYHSERSPPLRFDSACSWLPRRQYKKMSQDQVCHGSSNGDLLLLSGNLWSSDSGGFSTVDLTLTIPKDFFKAWNLKTVPWHSFTLFLENEWHPLALKVGILKCKPDDVLLGKIVFNVL